MYFSFALAGHGGTCLRPLHIFALLLLCCATVSSALQLKRSFYYTQDMFNEYYGNIRYVKRTKTNVKGNKVCCNSPFNQRFC